EQLLRKQHGRLAPEVMSEIMRDRSDGADSLSVEPGDGHGRMDGAAEGADGDERHSTVASVIAEPARRRIWAAPGPPSPSRYPGYSFAWGRGAAVPFWPMPRPGRASARRRRAAGPAGRRRPRAPPAGLPRAAPRGGGGLPVRPAADRPGAAAGGRAAVPADRD